MTRLGVFFGLIVILLVMFISTGNLNAAALSPSQATTTTVDVRSLPNLRIVEVPVDRLYDLFSALLVVVGFLQARILWHGYIAAHRPRLTIKQVTLLADRGDRPETAFFEQPIKVGMYVVNLGESRAKIVGGNITILSDWRDRPLEFRGSPNMGQLYSMECDNLKGTTLEPSISCLAKQQIDPLIANPENIASFANGPRTIYVVGYFDYRDRIGRVFRTAFCRRWDKPFRSEEPIYAQGKFTTVDDPNYEYAS